MKKNLNAKISFFENLKICKTLTSFWRCKNRVAELKFLWVSLKIIYEPLCLRPFHFSTKLELSLIS